MKITHKRKEGKGVPLSTAILIVFKTYSYNMYTDSILDIISKYVKFDL
jgi:hypothetical protein